MQVDETAFAMFKEQLNSHGTHHDASLQKELQNFCKKITQTSESQYMTEWLDEKYSRPLWQLGIIAMMSNKGIVMMVYGQSHQAELLTFDPPPDDPAAVALLGATGTLLSDSTLTTPQSPAEIAPVATSTPLIAAQSGEVPDLCETAAQSPYEPILAYEASAGSAFEAELASLSLT